MKTDSTKKADNRNKENSLEYKKFTPALAAFDALPVLLFGGTTIVLGLILRSPVFIAGATLSFLAGFGKVVWKFIVALKGKNIPWLSKQMRFIMPSGFVLMILGFFLRPKDAGIHAVLENALRLPVLPFLVLGLIGFVLMGVFAAKLDSKKAKNNWIEEATNTFGQLSFFIAAILLYTR